MFSASFQLQAPAIHTVDYLFSLGYTTQLPTRTGIVTIVSIWMDIAAADGLCFPVLYHKMGIRLLHTRVNNVATRRILCINNFEQPAK
jgi:hypothetical protein